MSIQGNKLLVIYLLFSKIVNDVVYFYNKQYSKTWGFQVFKLNCRQVSDKIK